MEVPWPSPVSISKGTQVTYTGNHYIEYEEEENNNNNENNGENSGENNEETQAKKPKAIYIEVQYGDRKTRLYRCTRC